MWVPTGCSTPCASNLRFIVTINIPLTIRETPLWSIPGDAMTTCAIQYIHRRTHARGEKDEERNEQGSNHQEISNVSCNGSSR